MHMGKTRPQGHWRRFERAWGGGLDEKRTELREFRPVSSRWTSLPLSRGRAGRCESLVEVVVVVGSSCRDELELALTSLLRRRIGLALSISLLASYAFVCECNTLSLSLSWPFPS